MSETENVFRAILECANRRDVEDMQKYLADSLVYWNPMTGQTDKKGMYGFHADLFQGFPDMTYRIDRTILQGDRLAAECTVKGTHRKELAGIPATNKTVEFPLAFLIDVRGGKIQKWSAYFDVAGMMRQLGVAK